MTSRIRFPFGVVIGFVCSILFGFAAKTQNQFHPKSFFILEKAGYTVSYDGRTKGASWVYELLTPESVSNEVVSRDHFDFSEDAEIPKPLRSTNKDFHRSGYDRGHLHPAMNAVSDPKAMKDSFLLSNASPQAASLNRGLWKELELKIRDLARSGKSIHVYTLPLFLPVEQNGKRFVHYAVIGENDVAVPTHFAKVAVIKGEKPLAYLFPNEPIPKEASLETFKTTIEKVARAAGVVFSSL